MASVLMTASNKMMSSDAQSIVNIRSIEVNFEGERNKYPISIKASFGKDETYESKQYSRSENVHWLCERKVSSNSSLTIVVQEHHTLSMISGPTPVKTVTIPMTKLVSKLLFEDKDSNATVAIHCGTDGPFIEVIRRLVKQSQNQLESMKVFMEKFEKACKAFDYVVTITEAVSSVHPAVESAAKAASALLEFCQKLTRCYKSATELMGDVSDFLPFADIPERGLKCQVTAQTIQEMLLLFEQICKAMITYSSGPVLGGLLEDCTGEISSFKEKFQKLKETFRWCLTTEIWRTTMKIEANTDDLLVRKLKPVMEASYREDRRCFEGSRMDTLRAIKAWSESDSSPPVFWLSGSSGLGKSQVAHTVARLFDEQDRLAAYFFAEKEHSSERVMPTIAYQLAKWHADYRSTILDILRGKEELQLYMGLSKQFELLMKQCVTEISTHPAPGQKPLIIVLDALENCHDPPSCIRPFVDYVVEIATLVPWLKVFVTSSVSEAIKSRLGKFETAIVKHFAMDDPTLDLHCDIAVYARLCEERRVACKEWVPGIRYDVLGLLTRISISCNASIALGSMELPSPITDTWIMEGAVLIFARSVLGRICEDDIPMARSILSITTCLISAKSPTEDVLFHFLHPRHPGITRDYVHDIISHLSPIIYSTGENMLHLLPPPDIFSEYLSNRQESGHLCIDTESLRYEVAQFCLNLMSAELDLSICGLGDPRLSGEDALDVKESSAHVSGVLRYCALCWTDLVTRSGNTELHHEVANLLRTHKIFVWIKVLSLLDELDAGREILLKCADQYKAGSKVLLAAKDLSHFEPAIKQGVPHFYTSMLTWSPPGSSVTNGVARGSLSGRSLAFEGIAKRTEGATYIDSIYDIFCVARSPDGSKIVSGNEKGTLEIWNGWTGERIGGPIEGHTGWVFDVKYSPDGTKFVSGSDDSVVKIWDARTGKLILQLESDSAARTVAYSPNGGRVASGHEDGSVRIWDTQNGTLVAESQDRHKSWVYSVSYSLDGTRIVSGSWDDTLMIWDAESGAAVSLPIKGHKNIVSAVAHSPDGSRIVSGSWDTTVRIWDAHSGTPIGEPLKGHEHGIRAIGFSQDGNTIISASNDATIRFWNASDGASVGVLRRGESRWDTERQHFVSIPRWWPHWDWRSFTTQALIYSANPIYIPDDGWIRTLDGGLFLWVPPEHRACSCHAASESTMTTNPLDERLKNSAWKHIPEWADIKRMMTEEESK